MINCTNNTKAKGTEAGVYAGIVYWEEAINFMICHTIQKSITAEASA